MERRYIILSVILAILLVVNLLTPFTGDVLVGFGAAFQADHLGDFPLNVYRSWNLRGIGYKYMLYSIYRLVGIFTDTDNTLQFQILAKLVYYSLFLSLSYVFFRQIKDKLNKLSIGWVEAFFIFLIAVLTNAQWHMLQAEETAIFLAVGMVSFSLSDNRYLNYASGLFIPLILSLKVITISYAALVFLFVLYLRKHFRSQLKCLIISSAVFTVLTVLFYLFVIPQEVTDTIDATYFQSSFQFGLVTLVRFVKGFGRAAFYAPFLSVGLIFYVFLLVHSVSTRNRVNLLFLITLAAILLLTIMVQSGVPPYQFLPFIFASVVLVILAFHIADINYKRLSTKLRVQELTYGLVLVIWFFTVIINLNIPYITTANYFVYKRRVDALAETCQLIEDTYQLSNEPEVLFLTPGAINYFIRSKSYLRHFFPLPLQRVKFNERLRETEVFKESLARLLDYSGKYVVASNWFDLSLLPSVSAKLENEYVRVHDESIQVFRTK